MCLYERIYGCGIGDSTLEVVHDMLKSRFVRVKNQH